MQQESSPCLFHPPRLAQELEQAGALAQQSLELSFICPPGNKNSQLCRFGPHQTVEIFPSVQFLNPGAWGKSSFPPQRSTLVTLPVFSLLQCFPG